MKYCGLNKFDTANGPGIRVSLFVSGCSLHCRGCFNPDSWNFDYGNDLTKEVEDQIIEELKQPWIAGFSLLGGDPFEPQFEEHLTAFCSRIKKEVGKPVWAWTGRKHEKIKSTLLDYIDVLVDGPFIESKKIDHKWFGSSNQRIIHLR